MNTSQLPVIPTLALEIEGKLRVLVLRSMLIVEPSWYLAQMYIAASEYQVAVEMLVSANSTVIDFLHNVKRLREITKTLKYNAGRFINGYSILEAYFQDAREDGRSNQNPYTEDSRDSLVKLHQKHKQTLRQRLQEARCSEYASEKFADDVLDLLSETKFLQNSIGSLVGEDNNDNIRRILSRIASPWTSLGTGHGLYHIGEYDDEDAGLYNLGVLGWSLAILAEANTNSHSQ